MPQPAAQTTHQPTSLHPDWTGSVRPVPMHDAAALTGPLGQAHIILGDQVYTLRITRLGKLILTK